MSFILDALKKSESERQQQAGADFSDVPTRSPEGPSFKWLWILAIILLINLAVLLGILLRPDNPSQPGAPPVQPAAAPPAPTANAAEEPTFEERVAEATRDQPEPVRPDERRPTTQAAPAPEPADEPAPEPEPAANPVATGTDRSYFKTIDELRLEGALQIPDLHLDIHVYADEPAERFVFINMNKHKENTQLAEGPVVKEITTDGVILEHQGMTFLLPRE